MSAIFDKFMSTSPREDLTWRDRSFELERKFMRDLPGDPTQQYVRRFTNVVAMATREEDPYEGLRGKPVTFYIVTNEGSEEHPAFRVHREVFDLTTWRTTWTCQDEEAFGELRSGLRNVALDKS